MDINAITVGIPVSDLAQAVAWYQRAFELGEPDLAPMEGIVEFNLEVFWLQLYTSNAPGGDGLSANIGVRDATAQQRRLAGLGLKVSDVERVEGVVEYFALTDPDGNKIGFATELS